MKFSDMLKVMNDRREGRLRGSQRERPVKEGRELRGGRQHYIGGTSGYTGPCTSAPLTARPMVLVEKSSLPADQRQARGGRNSRRKRKNQWVPA